MLRMVTNLTTKNFLVVYIIKQGGTLKRIIEQNQIVFKVAIR